MVCNAARRLCTRLFRFFISRIHWRRALRCIDNNKMYIVHVVGRWLCNGTHSEYWLHSVPSSIHILPCTPRAFSARRKDASISVRKYIVFSRTPKIYWLPFNFRCMHYIRRFAIWLFSLWLAGFSLVVSTWKKKFAYVQLHSALMYTKGDHQYRHGRYGTEIRTSCIGKRERKWKLSIESILFCIPYFDTWSRWHPDVDWSIWSPHDSWGSWSICWDMLRPPPGSLLQRILTWNRAILNYSTNLPFWMIC